MSCLLAGAEKHSDELSVRGVWCAAHNSGIMFDGCGNDVNTGLSRGRRGGVSSQIRFTPLCATATPSACGRGRQVRVCMCMCGCVCCCVKPAPVEHCARSAVGCVRLGGGFSKKGVTEESGKGKVLGGQRTRVGACLFCAMLQLGLPHGRWGGGGGIDGW